ncbi:MAG: hypothetical protein J0M17_10835 [Planctomycetes bacterium]|nr:hypothetical protein [Planctomycetota bacterium]
MNEQFPDIERLRLTGCRPTTQSPVNSTRIKISSPAGKVQGEFLKGPIRLDWLGRAAGLPGKSLAVAIAIMFEVGRRRSQQIKLTTAILDRFHVGRKAKYQALKQLEGANLVSVVRRPRKNPLVTVLSVSDQQSSSSSLKKE